MSLTTDKDNPCLQVKMPDGQQACYLVLSDEEKAKGFVRPVRRTYKHIGPEKPKYPLRTLTDEEYERYIKFGYSAYEEYPESELPTTGKFWMQDELARIDCNGITSMGQSIAETYARNPKFYGGTFCCKCGKHYPVGEFVWIDDGSVVGS